MKTLKQNKPTQNKREREMLNAYPGWIALLDCTARTHWFSMEHCTGVKKGNSVGVVFFKAVDPEM